MSTNVQLEIFEGPLDLLLHLIKKNEVSITDIPIAVITEQYLATLDVMQTLNLDVAGEFLVMAATLVHIKSRMLLPVREEGGEEDEGDDPREQLARRFLEYERFKDAAEQLGQREILDPRRFHSFSADGRNSGAAVAGGLGFRAIAALRRVLERLPKENVHEVTLDKITVREKMTLLLERLRREQQVLFESLFSEVKTRMEVVVTFLAMLELVKVRAIKIFQEESRADYDRSRRWLRRCRQNVALPEPRKSSMEREEIRSVVESLLFVADVPLTLQRLGEVINGVSKEEMQSVINEFQAELESGNRGVRLVEVAGGYQLRTAKANADWVKKLLGGRPARMSRATLETLAIIAYRQPITKAEIEAIRGVDADGVVNTLFERDLIRAVARKDVPGRPFLYGTTQQFSHFQPERSHASADVKGNGRDQIAGGRRRRNPLEQGEESRVRRFKVQGSQSPLGGVNVQYNLGFANPIL